MKKYIFMALMLLAGAARADNHVYHIDTDTITVRHAIVFPDGSVQVSSPAVSAPSVTLQTLYTASVDFSSTTSSTYIRTTLSQAITLQDASYRVKVCFSGLVGVSDASNVGYVTIKRDSTDLDATGYGFVQVQTVSAAASFYDNVAACAVDAPGDTDPHTYAVCIKNDDNSHVVTWNSFPGTATITLEEKQ